MKEEIKSAVSEAYQYLQKLANGGIAGVNNCQFVSLIAANLHKISELAEKIEEKTEGNDGGKDSDDICGQ